MTRAYLWYIIGTDQGYWLDDEGAPSKCNWIDDKGLIPASHCYAKVMARWRKVLAGYAGQPNLDGNHI